MDNDYTIKALLERGEFKCRECGKTHKTHLKDACIEKVAVSKLPDYINMLGGNYAYIICDNNTLSAAGNKVKTILENAGIRYKVFMLKGERPEPDESNIGSAMLHFDNNCNIVIGVGSGVVNDIGKIVAAISKLPYIIVGTAPSMDGYASATSSVIRDNLKVSVNSVCPDVVIGDTDILCKAPVHMCRAGLGDMIAKYVSICEWRIGNIVTGEYYCEEIARIIRSALKKCVDASSSLQDMSEECIKAIMEGMVISGIAADYAGVSRPVSGTEHYFSHIWDMRALEFETPWDFHGIQCGIGTVLTLKAYEFLKTADFNPKFAEEITSKFDFEDWKCVISERLGSASKAIIELEDKEKKYSRENHQKRMDAIIENKEKILQIIDEELPSAEYVRNILVSVGAPTTPDEIGIPSCESSLTFNLTKDIRFKYILSTLMWDLGLSDKAEEIFK